MKIALFGYGKMGKMIALLAEGRGHTIVAKIDVDTEEIDYNNMDVAIDFSMPEAALKNIKQLLFARNMKVPFCMLQILVWGCMSFLS
jgi:4-hydroxy-tetrahydrodipicolinate reductase